MLEPEYLLDIAEGAEIIAGYLHNEILEKIVARIVARIGRGDDYILTPVDKWSIETLQSAGYLLRDIKADIQRYTSYEAKEIAEAMEEAGVKALKYDAKIYEAAGISNARLQQSPYMVRLMQRNYEKTMGTWKNFTGTTAEASQRLFINECDNAYHKVMSHATSYTEAVSDAVEKIAKHGVTVEYPSGHTDTIETATLRAVRTGVGQACAEISEERMKENNWDIVLVSAHLGARMGDGEPGPGNHFWWQGKFYSRSGKGDFPDFVTSTGYGTGEGLCGWNCRHSFGPGDGIHNPYQEFDSEENQRIYELTQRQRRLERRIRNTKREVMALDAAAEAAKDPELQAKLKEAYKRKAVLLKRQNADYNDFCEENELRPLADRLKIAKWNREQAAKAAGAARSK